MGRETDPSSTEAQLTQLRNMRVHIEEAKVIARDLAYHRRAKLEARLDLVLAEIEREIEELFCRAELATPAPSAHRL